jgi:hypothetical protein
MRASPCSTVRAEDMSFMGAVMEGIFTVPGDGFITILRFSACSPTPTIPAGWWSRPSRIEQGAPADLCDA